MRYENVAPVPLRTFLCATSILILATACYPPVERLPVDPRATPEVAGKDGMATPRQAREDVRKVAVQAPDPDAFNRLLLESGELSHVPIFKESRARLLIDGPATYRVMGEAIDHARQTIYLETYIFADDKVGQQFARRLQDKAREGVAVRVIYDSLGSMSSSDDFFKAMESAGVVLIEYNSISPIASSSTLTVNNRDHRKLLIVDDTVAFTGGINFSKTYSSSSPHKPTGDKLTAGWRDTHIAIYGPAVKGFKHMFREQWRRQGGAAGDVPESNVTSDKAGTDLIVALQSDGGGDTESPIYRAYVEAIKMAERRIWITQAYFAPNDKFMDHLKHAAERGVDVRILVPGISDSKVVLYASRSHYGDLLSHGVRVYENDSAVLHAKTAVIDGIWSTVGSSNLDFRSFLHNDEVNAIVLGKDFAKQMEDQFATDLNTSKAMSLEEWQDRPLTDRLQETFGRSMEYWL
jgi:cardiolipin synthase A/B